MPVLSYRQYALTLKRSGAVQSGRQVRDLQRDLRRLGYLKSGIDGDFGAVTQRAVKALQHELLFNDGASRSGDGRAPVAVRDYNRGRVTAVTGEATQPLVECISDILDDGNFPKLPQVADPAAENRKIIAEIAGISSPEVPIPFLLAVLKQESSLMHFHEPPPGDEDTYITVGLDAKPPQDYVVTSRGYGAGQYTLFHHPPRPDEVDEFMLDVGGNLRKAVRELKEKFTGFVNGRTPGTQADDRIAEFGTGPLRVCQYAPGSPTYLRDCKACLRQAGVREIRAGVTPWYRGSNRMFEPTPYHSNTLYAGVPVRARIPCDWPYAVRRYNGSGMDSYHYQAQVLKNVVELKIA